MAWSVSNHRLYGGASSIFIVGVSQSFNQSGETYSEKADWTNATNNRNLAGNAVYAQGNYFGKHGIGNDDGLHVLTAMKDHSNMLFFSVNFVDK